MTKTDFFRLIIKIFGLYSVILVLFSVLPGNLAFVITDFSFLGIVWQLITIAVIILLFMFLIYKPDVVIRWLKLDKGFDEERIDLKSLSTVNLLKLAVILLGGILLINNIPSFLSHTYFGFKSSVMNEISDVAYHYNVRDNINWLTSFLNLVVGYLLLTNYSYISKFLKEKDDK